jgi:hypothetical protein
VTSRLQISVGDPVGDTVEVPVGTTSSVGNAVGVPGETVEIPLAI